MKQPPQGFTGAPGNIGPTARPAPQQVARVVSAPVAPELTLTVSQSGRVYPSRLMAAALGLRHGQPISLDPPRGPWNSSLPWHLDTRPTAMASLTVLVNGNIYPQFQCCHPPKRSYFRRRGLYLDSLTLALSGPPTEPGYLPLLPLYAYHP